MGIETGIEWTTSTFNPWWGCVKVSAECKNCYADTFSKRVGKPLWGTTVRRRFFDAKHWNEPLNWQVKAAKSGKPWRVFCASMADVFEQLPADHPDGAQMAAERARLWRLSDQTPALTWLLLTKRPENITQLSGWDRLNFKAPRPNVWFGTSVGVPETRERLHYLSLVPAAVHFISVEPLLADVGDLELEKHHIEWVITGGESGGLARELKPEWVRGVRDQCERAGVAMFHKQWGKPENNPLWWSLGGVDQRGVLPSDRRAFVEKADPIGKGGSLVDGRHIKQFPVTAQHPAVTS